MVILHIIHCIIASMLASDEIQTATELCLRSRNTAMRNNRKWKIQDAAIEQKVSLYLGL